MLGINCTVKYREFGHIFRLICGRNLRLLEYKPYSTFSYETIADETLESLHEYFEDLIEGCSHLPNSDTIFSSGVLTVNFGTAHGTYVINKQTPNEQIWLSSPISGPKRYDYMSGIDAWIYKHNNQSLHQLLQLEIPTFIEKEVNFLNCKHSGGKS